MAEGKKKKKMGNKFLTMAEEKELCGVCVSVIKNGCVMYSRLHYTSLFKEVSQP